MAGDDCFFKPTPESIACTLGRKLIGVVDKANNIPARLGLRPYVVRVIHTTWSGPSRGLGAEQVVREAMILPVPEVLLNGVRKQITAVGMDEVGNIQLTQVSGRYTEAEVLGAEIAGVKIDPNMEQAFYEILFVGNGTNERRRFSVSGVPSYKADDFAWTVSLERAREDRDAYTGDPQ